MASTFSICAACTDVVGVDKFARSSSRLSISSLPSQDEKDLFSATSRKAELILAEKTVDLILDCLNELHAFPSRFPVPKALKELFHKLIDKLIDVLSSNSTEGIIPALKEFKDCLNKGDKSYRFLTGLLRLPVDKLILYFKALDGEYSFETILWGKLSAPSPVPTLSPYGAEGGMINSK